MHGQNHIKRSTVTHKTIYDILHDIKHKTVGVLYLENFKQFHGTHVKVIPFKSI